jgi:hypothetical protein
LKDDRPIVSIVEGMQIDDSDEQPQNTEPPRHQSLEPDSNVTREREEQHRKQYPPIVLTVEGMQIDDSDEQSRNTESPRNES